MGRIFPRAEDIMSVNPNRIFRKISAPRDTPAVERNLLAAEEREHDARMEACQ